MSRLPLRVSAEVRASADGIPLDDPAFVVAQARLMVSMDDLPSRDARPGYGRTFWLSRNTLSGSQARLSATSRSYLASP